jgi:hypothetical protein
LKAARERERVREEMEKVREAEREADARRYQEAKRQRAEAEGWILVDGHKMMSDGRIVDE